MSIELRSTEIALVTPFGVMMQIRPSDHNQLGMWGGVLNDGEEPIVGAFMVVHMILDHQQDFIKRILQKNPARKITKSPVS